ncbi:PBSX family phage terminase large subunit [Pseudoflavonifractor sp. 524-17]|uniref:PBSX family phage terminase large subunit n=1 Tax=Pseudoflavonifractor sp. 524-17 TaxID=2304577 RepID=UPI00137A4D1F|nr:PBSX family phage terminase large subunit [Pseudoflavonifractor sp. 524-17]NCE63715.1 PBSX family phage terminase large subunit [Pseudoflavonifractor sp. 524-17]
MILTQTIPWADFSDKHKRYINAALENKICVAEGAIRSGKTIDHCIIAAAHLELCRDRIHLASGSTIGNAKLNIGVCNGFGLEALFRGRCKWGKYRDNEALFLYTQTGEKVVVFAGGGKADSYKRILGNSYGLWIATEINEHYDSDDSRESFIKVAFGRQVAALDPLVLWDLNPCNPKHRIYEDYIDKYQRDKQPGYLYEHFTIDDNLSITDERREEIKSRYDPNSVWYKRDILGKRCIAEGLIYQTFADNTSDFLIDDPLSWCRENNQRITRVMIGVDFGGTKSATTFVAVGITNKLTVLALDQDWMDSNDLDPDKLNRRFVEFARRVTAIYGEAQTRADNEESVLIRGIRNAVQRENLRCSVHNAKKMEIKNRIKLTQLLMAQKRLYVARKCEHLIDAFQTAVYDPKSYEDVRLDDGTSDIDSLDAFEYGLEPWYQQLLKYGEKPYQSILGR